MRVIHRGTEITDRFVEHEIERPLRFLNHPGIEFDTREAIHFLSAIGDEVAIDADALLHEQAPGGLAAHGVMLGEEAVEFHAGYSSMLSGVFAIKIVSRIESRWSSAKVPERKSIVVAQSQSLMEPSTTSQEKNADRSFAFFDLDHTLLPFDTQAMFCNFVLQQERARSFFLLGFLPIAILRACKLVRTVTVKRAFMGYLTGMNRETLRQRARDFAEKVVKPQIYPELLAIIEEHRKAGRILVLNTASPDFYPHEIARILGFDHCIATKIESHDPMPFMPVVIGTNNKREAKIAAMRRELPDVLAATEQQLKDSWSYSDSAADLPLLEFAGNAMLIHPNSALAAIGTEKGWKILKPERPYTNKLGDILSSLRQALGIYYYRRN